MAFVFPGQGSQWAAWAGNSCPRPSTPRVRRVRCRDRRRDRSPIRRSDRGGSDGRLARTEIVQPVLWAIAGGAGGAVASCGFEPDAVIGHSMGEVAAACVAGALSVERRGRGDLPAQRPRGPLRTGGARRRWTELTAAQAAQAVAGHDVVVAACNGPRTTVSPVTLRPVTGLVAEPGVMRHAARLVIVDFPSHCPQIHEIHRSPPGALDAPAIPARARADRPRCWAASSTEPGSTPSTGCATSASRSTSRARSAPSSPGRDGLRRDQRASRADHGRSASMAQPVTRFGSLRREAPEWQALLDTLADVHVLGVPFDWSPVTPGGHAPCSVNRGSTRTPASCRRQEGSPRLGVLTWHSSLGVAQPAGTDGSSSGPDGSTPRGQRLTCSTTVSRTSWSCWTPATWADDGRGRPGDSGRPRLRRPLTAVYA